MRTIALDIRDDYYDKFISLLDALPKGAVKAVELSNGSLSKEVLSRVASYKNKKSKIAPVNDKFWDEMDRYLEITKE